MSDYLDRVYFHNTIQDYLVAFSIILLGSLLITIFRRSVLIRIRQWAEKTTSHFDDYVVQSLARFGVPILHFTVVYIGITSLQLTPRAAGIVQVAITVAVTFMVIRFITTTLIQVVRTFFKRKHPDRSSANEIGALSLIVNMIVWFLGMGFLFDNMGYDLTAIIAGLGIGGIAVALAAQNILGDLFNYFVIFLDRPFEVGDFISIGDKNGTIEHIGVKTTHLKSLTGEQLIISNSDLTSSRIHNFKRMERRRIQFGIGVTYETPAEKLEAIPGIIKDIITKQELAEFDRAHFASYGDSSLDFVIVYHVLTSDFNKYMDTQQTINMRLFRAFQEQGIEFAYPTQKLYLANEKKEQLNDPQRMY